MAASHPDLEGAEDVLDRPFSDVHGVGHVVEADLHGLDDILMLPTGDAALFCWRAIWLQRALTAVARPVSVERQPLLDIAVAQISVSPAGQR